MLLVFCLFTFVLCLLPNAAAQSGRRSPSAGDKKTRPDANETKPTPTPAPAEAEPEVGPALDEDEDAVTVETNLVTVPVIVSDRGNRYVSDIKQEEFSVFEEGVEQKIAFFAQITEPFHVVLMLDTSASTTVEKLRQVQEAAVAFVNQLQSADRVKVISFDDEIRDLCDFTGDRDALASAIRSTRPGKGTRLYDAFDMAFRQLRRTKGRKAIVLLTDGVDWHSDRKTYSDNRKALEESDVIVYPVRFDTREETERLARAQANGGGAIDLGTIFGGKLPGSVIINPRGGRDPRDRRVETDPRRPPDATTGTGRPPDATTGRPDYGNDDSIDNMLDNLYRMADEYLAELERLSGGTLLRADNPSALPRAFSLIADELRTQYSLGYYPSNSARDGKYRKIRVRSTRKNVSVRARPGYRARKAAQSSKS